LHISHAQRRIQTTNTACKSDDDFGVIAFFDFPSPSSTAAIAARGFALEFTYGDVAQAFKSQGSDFVVQEWLWD